MAFLEVIQGSSSFPSQKENKSKTLQCISQGREVLVATFFPLNIHLVSLFYSSQLLEETEGEGGADVPFYGGMKCELNFQESESFTYVGNQKFL